MPNTWVGSLHAISLIHAIEEGHLLVVTRKEQMFLSPLVTVSSALLMITTHLDQSGYLCSTVLFAVWEIIRGWTLLKKKTQQVFSCTRMFPMGSPHLILAFKCFQWDHLLYAGNICKNNSLLKWIVISAEQLWQFRNSSTLNSCAWTQGALEKETG